MNEPMALKYYFDERLARRLGILIVGQYASFPAAFFIREVAAGYPRLS